MAGALFKQEEFSEVYHKHMIEISPEVLALMLNYVENKVGNTSNLLAVDIGCGTGNVTRKLAPHFLEVIGLDFSESQLKIAREVTTEKNITYHLSPSENFLLADNSVDLINATCAVHFFNIDKFMHEVVRVLKPGGCLALSSLFLKCEIRYKDLSEALTNIFHEALRRVCMYGSDAVDHLKSEYQTIFKAVPFTDKERFTDLPMIYPVSVKKLVGLIQATFMYQDFLMKNQKDALLFLQNLEKSFSELGISELEATMELHSKSVCVLAYKPKANA
uniref:Methyltransferase type 11 domain-containing protein n=1 Tax=Leptobrachium leishanense TaxID=445787 RepID=A0A8C5MZD6_9ANUR